MKRKLITLMTLLLCVCSGAWADISCKTIISSGGEVYIVNPSNMATYYNSGNGWVTNGSGGEISSESYYNSKTTTKNTSYIDPDTETTGTKNSATGITIKTADDRSARFYFTGATAVYAFTASTGNSRSSTLTVYKVSDNSQVGTDSEDGSSGSYHKLMVTGLTSTENYYAKVTATNDMALYAMKFFAPAAATKAPGTPTLTVDGGSVNGGSTTTIASSDASKIYYCWNNNSTPPAQDAEDTWTEIEGDSYEFTIPNVTANPMYLHAYGWNSYNTSTNSATKTSSAFDVTKIKLAAGLSYATTAISKTTGHANFTNTLSNPNSLAGITYSIEAGATATGVSVNSTTGEITIGSVPGTATIKASFAGNDDYYSGNATYTLTVVALDEQTDVTGLTTWDWSEATDGPGNFDGTDLRDEDVLFSNISKYGFKAVSGLGNQQSLLMNGQYAYREANGYKLCQVNYLKFNTTVAGNVTVVYANTGTSDTRTVQVNSTLGKETTSTNSSYKTETFAVEAGSVTIKGRLIKNSEASDDKMLRINKVVFTPTETVNVTSYGWASFNSDNALDLTSFDYAYEVTGVSGSSVTLNQVTEAVAANTPLLIKGTVGSAVKRTIPVTTSDNVLGSNKLVAVTSNGTSVAQEANKWKYVLAVQDGVAVFAPIGGTAATLNKGQAYLELTEEPSARFLSIDFEESTGIHNMEVSKGFEFGEIYDMQGRRVERPAKGLYIMNGKKVIIK